MLTGCSGCMPRLAPKVVTLADGLGTRFEQGLSWFPSSADGREHPLNGLVRGAGRKQMLPKAKRRKLDQFGGDESQQDRARVEKREACEAQRAPPEVDTVQNSTIRLATPRRMSSSRFRRNESVDADDVIDFDSTTASQNW